MLFVGIALLLRNVWVWLHALLLAEEDRHGELIPHLEKLCFRQMLNRIDRSVVSFLHNGELYFIELPGGHQLAATGKIRTN